MFLFAKVLRWTRVRDIFLLCHKNAEKFCKTEKKRKANQPALSSSKKKYLSGFSLNVGFYHFQYYYESQKDHTNKEILTLSRLAPF